MESILEPSLQGFLWVLAIGLTVVVLDVFFETEVLSATALLGISIYTSLLFDVALKWRILVTLGCWVLVMGAFYLGWKRFVVPLLRRGVAGGIAESVHGAVGATGEFRLIDGKPMVYWNGDLWPIQEETDVSILSDSEEVLISGYENGMFRIQTRSESSSNKSTKER